MQEGITVLSLFDGMSCGQIALKRLGIKVKKYFASEIDKHAIKVTMANFPDTIQLGDVTQVRAEDLPKIDLLIGGSPCQGFSFAGKGLNFNDPRSRLFFEFVRLLEILKPKYFLLENVRMNKKYELIISKQLGIAPLLVNSALVSAQNRERLYWTNIGLVNQGLFGNPVCAIPQPKDQGILLKDILEPEVDEKYYLKGNIVLFDGRMCVEEMDSGVNYCIDANGRVSEDKTGAIVSTYSKGTEQYGSRPFILKINKQGELKTNQDKASCFTAGANSGGNHSDMDLLVQIGNIYNEETNPQAGRVYDIEGKSVTLKGEGGGGGAKTGLYLENKPIQLNQSTESNGKQPYQQNRVYDEQGKMIALDTDHRKNVLHNCRIRRLTPLECERLQTVEDGYTAVANTSDTQRYKMLGNGWTVAVIEHIFKYMKF